MSSSAIHDATPSFQFDKISLTTPASITGGAHFSKIIMDKNPLYIQTPKCSTKNGIIGSGRKMYADLVFTNENEEIIQWMEILETTIRRKIYDNRGKWFDTEMSEDDIEGCFSPMVRVFRSGKQYCIRVNINSKPDAKPLKIYDEDEINVDAAQITDKTPLIAILEIQGVRCTSKSFCIDVEIKQLMVMKQNDLFDSCIISQGKKDPGNRDPASESKPHQYNLAKLEKSNDNIVISTQEPLILTELIKTQGESINMLMIEEPSQEEPLQKEPSQEEPLQEETSLQNTFVLEEHPLQNTFLTQDHLQEDLEKDTELLDIDDILEVNLDVNEIDITDTFQLKDKKDVYYEMYREALQKAKVAKTMALTSFMEARRIKNLYMLNDLNDSDEESDLEDLDDLEDE
jgi:hypothetical protein